MAGDHRGSRRGPVTEPVEPCGRLAAGCDEPRGRTCRHEHIPLNAPASIRMNPDSRHRRLPALTSRTPIEARGRDAVRLREGKVSDAVASKHGGDEGGPGIHPGIVPPTHLRVPTDRNLWMTIERCLPRDDGRGSNPRSLPTRPDPCPGPSRAAGPANGVRQTHRRTPATPPTRRTPTRPAQRGQADAPPHPSNPTDQTNPHPTGTTGSGRRTAAPLQPHRPCQHGPAPKPSALGRSTAPPTLR